MICGLLLVATGCSRVVRAIELPRDHTAQDLWDALTDFNMWRNLPNDFILDGLTLIVWEQDRRFLPPEEHRVVVRFVNYTRELERLFRQTIVDSPFLYIGPQVDIFFPGSKILQQPQNDWAMIQLPYQH